jgi:K+-transporting ATPase KdpF subunit
MGAVPPGVNLIMPQALLGAVITGIALYLVSVILYPEKF